MKKFEHRVDEFTERRHAIAVANSVGAEGWELVSVVQNALSINHVDLYFRRVLPSQQHNNTRHVGMEQLQLSFATDYSDNYVVDRNAHVGLVA